jgi:hypothetical protein
MNHAELTSALAGISDHIHIKKLDIKSQQKRLVFALQYAVHQDLAPDRSRADSAKIALADLYIQMNALQYQLEVLVEEQKNIKKSLARLAA